MNYTPQQLDAINSRHEDILVSAAAGSGKTRVLIDRIVAMVLGRSQAADGTIRLDPQDRVPVMDMLIVTFTNAAAGEMRTRLEQGLRQALDQYREDAETEDYLAAQLEALPDAHISTMHAFCISQMRQYYHVLDLDPSFRVLTEQAAAIMRDSALDQALQEGYDSANPAFMDLVEAYGGKRGDGDLRNMIRSLSFQVESAQDPAAWLARAADHASDPLPAAYVEAFREQGAQTIDELTSLCSQMRRTADSLTGMEKHHLMISDDETLVAGLGKNLLADEPIDAVMAFLDSIKYPKKPSKSKKWPPEMLEADDHIDRLHKRFKEVFKTFAGIFVQGGRARIEADRRLTAPYVAELVRLTLRYLDLYQDQKRARQGVDFSDLEHDMLALLADEETRRAIQQEVKYVFFDEYQDANPIQEAIVQRLATPDRLFFVGDVKQAIYRFRRSDPGIFNARYRLYRDGQGGRLIFLSQNFRSRREILRFANALFETLMTTQLGEIDYTEPGQSLVCGSDFPPDDQAVQLVTVVADKDKSRQDPEASWIADEIERLVAEGLCSYSDIAVLMRAPGARLRDYEDVFKRRRIPFYSDNSTVNFQNMEVRLFLSMLTVLNDDCLDQPLTAALLSPFGGLDDRDAARIRLHTPEGPFFEAVRNYRKDCRDDISAKLDRFYDNLAAWRRLLHYESIDETARRMFEESGYAAFLLGLDDGAGRYDNVASFIDQMAAYEQEESYGLPGFLHYTEVLSKRSMDTLSPGIGLTENDACVRIMSIHKSKGLGFKVVFLADTARNFNLTSRTPQMRVDPKLGLACDVVDLDALTTHASFEENVIAAQERAKSMSEEVRLLYVALTRAIDRLYIVARRKPGDHEKYLQEVGRASAHTPAFKGKRSFADWIALCLADPAHPLYEHARSPLYQRQVIDADQSGQEEEEAQKHWALPPAEDKTLEALSHRFSQDYPYQQDTLKPFKRTVSEIAKGRSEEANAHILPWPPLEPETKTVPEAVPVPRFLQEQVSFTAAAFGTLMHHVVQLLPLAPMDDETLIDQLNGLEDRALLTAQERDAVDMTMLRRFYDSSFVRDIAEKATDIEHETPFSLQYGDIQIDGQIDLFYRTPQGYVIVDFKTDRTVCPERYAKQLAIYAQALEKARHVPVVSRKLYWLRYGQISEV
jgi:ATP-dependent helicase/nuclease subunit A